MKRGAEWVSGALFFFAATFLYYWQMNGDTDFQSYTDWLRSMARGFVLKAKTTIGNASGQSNYLDIAASIISDFESFSPKVYRDAGHLAIGYGHDIVPGDGFDEASTISEPDAWSLLVQDIAERDYCISNSVHVDLTDNQRAALLSLVYNIGCTNFQGSTLVKLLNQGNYDSAADQFSVWNKSRDASGQLVVNQVLVDRRASEMGQFTA